MSSQAQLNAKSGMLIRRSTGEVFEALVNPDVTTQFWFTKSSGRLEEGKTVTWTWGQFGVSADITVTKIEDNKLIQFQWPSGEEESAYRTVRLSFESKAGGTTFVQVIESEFDKNDEQLINKIAGQTEGWALVLSAMKAWLEYGINLNLISDHKPNI
ncbi:SRPBCC family protein [Aliifodinibius salicampi]|uniref:SRPBCC family protein n=1 Tax=Fodinibius salicampi TaxID=1920655 RepID=A0ABT3PXD6_9BACT|nr:SRPBCC family protein [Fodinibius salicampi]MCW9712530.1 SRPBCC family protein [Fodinibius salicampi]